MDLYGKCISLTFFISLCLSYPLGWLADVVHPLRMLLATLACHIIVTLSGFFLISSPHSFLVAWISHGVLAGCFYTGTASLALRLFPQERFAQFASAAGIIGAPAGILLAPLVGMLIDSSGNAYRVTFLAGAILSGLALLAAWRVHGRFLLLGGPRNYQAP